MLRSPAKREIDAYLDGEELPLTPEVLAARRRAFVEAFRTGAPAPIEIEAR